DKSAIIFSPNVCSSDRLSLIQILRLPDVVSHDTYLGIPTVVGRNTKTTFAQIKEQVWKHTYGWRGSLFSMGGRKVLIKSVLQAIPSYVMSIFKLPVSFCEDL
ncbi:hypothetical protein TorRG33x02_152790, partial [Trema orientale]